MIKLTISYEVKWRVFGVTLGTSSGRVPFSFAVPGLNLPSGVWINEPLGSVGRGVKIGVLLETGVSGVITS